jgi:hypothetical protein
MAAPRPLPAQDEEPIYLSVTDKLDYRRLDKENRRDEAFRNRLEVSAYRGMFGAWLRLQSLGVSDANFYDPYGVAEDDVPGEQRIDGTELTRRLFTIDTEPFQMAVGDFSYVFGRGLMLSVFEDEELNYDTRLEGVWATWNHDRGSLTAIGGSRDGNRFRGLFAEPRSFGPARVAASFVEAWGAETATSIRVRERQAGALAEVGWGPASIYGEYVHREFPGGNTARPEDEDGHGGFVSGVISGAGLTLSGEYRDYEKFEHDFHDPPTSLKQHTWTLLNRVNGQVLADIDDNDVKGWLAEGEYSHDYFTSVRGSYGRADGDAGDDFWEVYGEAKGAWRERVFVTAAGAESELQFLSVFEERRSGFGEVVVELDDANSLTAGVEWEEVQETDALTAAYEFPREYRNRIYSLSYGRSPWLTLSLTHEDTTDETEAEDDWFVASAEIVLTESQDLTVSFGSERGGWKCTGGVCFFEPEFEGLKVRWVARY